MARETAGFFIDNFDGTRVESSQLPRGWVEVNQQTGQMFFKHLFMGGNIPRELIAGQDGTGVFNPFNVSAEGVGTGMHFIETTYAGPTFDAADVPGTPVENLKMWLDARTTDLQAEVDSLEEIWDLRLPPVADITPPASAAATTVVTFDSVASSGGGYTGAPVVLSNTTTFVGDAGGLVFDWDFGGNALFEPGFDRRSAAPDVTFPVAGSFPVILTVTDEFGRTYPEFALPNFSPAARTSVTYVAT